MDVQGGGGRSKTDKSGPGLSLESLQSTQFFCFFCVDCSDQVATLVWTGEGGGSKKDHFYPDVLYGWPLSGCLHAHISYLDDTCDVCLVLLTVNPEHFQILSDFKQIITEVNI